MKMAWYILFTVLLLVLSVVLYMSKDKEVSEIRVLSVEAIFDAAGIKFSDDLRKEVDAYQELFASQGFMSLYREAYRVSLDPQKYSFNRQLAAVSALLLVAHNDVDAGPLQSSGKRLFIHFCRLSLLDTIFALEMSAIEESFMLFTNDTVLHELWNDYLKQVWVKVVRPEIIRQRRAEKENALFVKLLPEFMAELSHLAEAKSPVGTQKLDFFLKEGRAGNNESDYELRETNGH